MPRRPKHLYVLKSRDGLDEIFARLQAGPLAVDTETSGLEWWKHVVGTINLAAGDTAIVALGDALRPTARYLSDQVKEHRSLVFHHAKFDLHHLRRTFGLHVSYLVHDTMVESFVVDNRGANAFGWRTKRAHSLKPLAEIYVDEDAPDHERELLAAIRRHGGKHKGDWAVLLGTEDEHLFTTYSALDPWYTLQLHLQFIERIRYWVQPGDYPSLMSVYERERWMIRAFLDMEERGVFVDRNFLETWREELAVELKKRERILWKLAKKRELNWNSTPQILDLLQNTLHLSVNDTKATTMLELPHPIGIALTKYRETYKQWSSYANSLLAAVTERSTIHPTFRSTGADTGRTSCADPNLQQQTRVSGVRKAYPPRRGLVLRFADYSQVEMRFAAHFSGEESLIKGFREDPEFDTHGAAAARMFGKLYDPATQHRKFAKIVNFTKLFGGGENKVTEQLVDLMEEREAIAGCHAMKLTLDRRITPFRTLARGIIKLFESTMPKLTHIIRHEAKVAEQRGYMMNAFGGHRFMDEGDDRWYAAFNTRVQGTAGIKAKEGLVNVYKELQLRDGVLACELLIHDEIVYESDGDPKTDRRVLELMQDVTSYTVPIIADMSGSATNWQEKEKIKL